MFCDATFCKVRVGAHVVSQALVVATGVSIDGTREVLGTAVGDSESYEFWREFLASLRARGLSGVHLVISDAHAGLKAAVAQQFTGSSWQRCRVHFMRNLHTAVAAKARPGGDCGGQDDLRPHRPRRGRRPMGPRRRHPGRVVPESGRDDGRRPRPTCWRSPRSRRRTGRRSGRTIPSNGLNKEIKRRADVVEIFPNPAAFLRLATAVVIEAHDEWQVTRRYLSDVSMDELRAVIAAKHAAAALAKQHQIT